MRLKVIVAALLLHLSTASSGQDVRYDEWYLITQDSVEIYVREIKNSSPKDTVIVVHGGFGANHDYMLDAIKGLEEDFHFVLYDQRGSLLSPAAPHKLTFDKNVQDLHALIEELNLKKAKLMCHSTGTLVAMELLKRYPEKVSNLVLTSAILPKSTRYEDVFSDRVYKTAEQLAQRPEYHALIEPYKKKGANLSDKEKTELWRIEFANYNTYKVDRWRLVKGGKAYYKKEAAVMGKADIWNFDYRDLLASHGNVTYIQGDKDFLDLDVSTIQELLIPYPQIRLENVKNSGHLVWIDEPQVFRQHLRKALK